MPDGQWIRKTVMSEVIERLKKEKEELENEKELTMSQEKLDHIDEQIFEIDDSLKKLGVVKCLTHLKIVESTWSGLLY